MTEEIKQETPEVVTPAETTVPEQKTESPAPQVTSEKNTGMAVVAYIIFFVPLLTGDAKKDAFVNYHVKQGLALFLVALVLNIIGGVIMPFIWLMIGWLVSLGILGLMILGIMNAVNGKQVPLPAIGFIADYFKF